MTRLLSCLIWLTCRLCRNWLSPSVLPAHDHAVCSISVLHPRWQSATVAMPNPDFLPYSMKKILAGVEVAGAEDLLQLSVQLLPAIPQVHDLHASKGAQALLPASARSFPCCDVRLAAVQWNCGKRVTDRLASASHFWHWVSTRSFCSSSCGACRHAADSGQQGNQMLAHLHRLFKRNGALAFLVIHQELHHVEQPPRLIPWMQARCVETACTT